MSSRPCACHLARLGDRGGRPCARSRVHGSERARAGHPFTPVATAKPDKTKPRSRDSANKASGANGASGAAARRTNDSQAQMAQSVHEQVRDDIQLAAHACETGLQAECELAYDRLEEDLALLQALKAPDLTLPATAPVPVARKVASPAPAPTTVVRPGPPPPGIALRSALWQRGTRPTYADYAVAEVSAVEASPPVADGTNAAPDAEYDAAGDDASHRVLTVTERIARASAARRAMQAKREAALQYYRMRVTDEDDARAYVAEVERTEKGFFFLMLSAFVLPALVLLIAGGVSGIIDLSFFGVYAHPSSANLGAPDF